MTDELLINIISSIIVGFSVWLWGKAQQTHALKRKSGFYGLKPNNKCLVVINNDPRAPHAMNLRDVQTLADLMKIIHEIRVEATIAHFDEVSEPPGIKTEFCLGGWESNRRTKSHLENYLKGVQVKPHDPDSPESIAIVTASGQFNYEWGILEHAILAKFYPKSTSHPVFLICGQTAITNRAAVHYLSENYDKFLQKKYGDKPFCLIIKVTSSREYGYKGAEIALDVTNTAFNTATNILL